MPGSTPATSSASTSSASSPGSVAGHPRSKAADRLLDAARDALLEGEGEVEMSDLARRAGVSVGLAYHYFRNKAGLLAAVIGAFYDRYDAVANQRYDGAVDWSTRERARLEATIDFLYADPMAPLVLDRMSRTAEVAEAEQARFLSMLDLSRRNIEDGQKRGFIPASIDAGIASAAIAGACRMSFIQAMRARQRPDAGQLADQLWRMIAGALRLSA